MKDFFVEDILEKFEDYTQPVDQGPSFMNQEPRNMYNQGSSVDHAVRTIDPVQDSGNKIEEVLKAYGRYSGNRKGGRMSFSKFFELFSRENFVDGGQAGQLVQPSIDGSRPGYSGNPLKKYLINNNGRRLGVEKMGTVPESSSKIIHSVYRDKKTGKEIDVYKVKITDKPSQIEGKMKAGKGGDYKTLLSGPDKTEFSTLKEAELARDNYYKENPLKRPKGSKNENKKKSKKIKKK